MLTRVIVGVVAALCAIGLLIIGGWAVWGLVVLAALLAVHEIDSALGVTHPFAKLPSYALAALIVPVRVLLGGQFVPMLLAVCLLLGFIPFVFCRADSARFPTSEVFTGVFPILYPLTFLYCFLLLTLFERSFSTAAFLAATVCPLLSDAFAMFGGTLFGKRKLIPEISPNKTIEGSVSGFVGGLAGGLVLYALQPVWGTSIQLWALLALGFVLSAFGQLGDLFASAIKRHCGIKDFGKILPGHGGVMDRIDSILFCAPVVYICFTLFIIG